MENFVMLTVDNEPKYSVNIQVQDTDGNIYTGTMEYDDDRRVPYFHLEDGDVLLSYDSIVTWRYI